MASAIDDIGGGGSSSSIGGISGGALVRLTNMAGPCVGQTPGVNCSEDGGRGDERGSGHGDDG
jgi:hypothetical protein